MEDVSLEDLIADVVANPTPRRVPCKPAASPTALPAAESRSGVFGKILRRLRQIVAPSTKT